MDPTLADREIRIAATWWSDLLVRHHKEALPVDRYASILGHAPIRPERVDAYQIALVARIESRIEMDLVLRDAAIPTIGEGRRTLEVVGSRAPSEVVTAADCALPHLSDGAVSAINPGHMVAYAGHRAGLDTTDVAALSGGGAA